MTAAELHALAKISDAPLGVPALDALYGIGGPCGPYYRFLYHLAVKMKPSLVVELGSYRGGSTAHLAAGAKCAVLAVEPYPQPQLSGVVKQYPNIDWRQDESLSKAVLDSVADQSVDLCFIDTVHTEEFAVPEYAAWSPKMKPGGIMLYDDITIDELMSAAWAKILAMDQRAKISLPSLHYSGFGAILF